MSITSQTLSRSERALLKKIVKRATAKEKKRLLATRVRITKSEVKKNNNVSQNIAQELRTKIINPFKQRHPNG